MLEKLKKDLLVARKAIHNLDETQAEDEKIKASLLTVLIGNIETAGLHKKENNQQEILSTLLNAEKSLKKLIADLKDKPAAKELLEKSKKELLIIAEYLPKQLSKEELTKIIADLKAKGENFGVIMKDLKANYNGQYDGKLAKEIFDSL